MTADTSGSRFSTIPRLASGAGVSIAVGPEGGFTESEVLSACGANWQAVSLGSRVLRVETATLALAAALAMQADNGQMPPASIGRVLMRQLETLNAG